LLDRVTSVLVPGSASANADDDRHALDSRYRPARLGLRLPVLHNVGHEFARRRILRQEDQQRLWLNS
jgi:hypothetical protein